VYTGTAIGREKGIYICLAMERGGVYTGTGKGIERGVYRGIAM
jgi:hypothetical protein